MRGQPLELVIGGLESQPGYLGERAGEAFGEIESVKAVSDLYSPVDGVIVEINKALPDQLESLGDDPYGAGWMVKIRVTDEAALGDLLDADAYATQCAEEGA